MRMLESQWMDVSCPKCTYVEGVKFISIRLQETIICHNCKVTIKLLDQTASEHVAASKINNAFKSLKDLKKRI